MNPRFQRGFNIATIEIQLRMQKLQEKWNGVQNNQSQSGNDPAAAIPEVRSGTSGDPGGQQNPQVISGDGSQNPAPA
jgi:hypothetical protein